MRCWESLGDLPLVIEIVVSFRSFSCTPLAKRHAIYITRGRSPGLSQECMLEPISLQIIISSVCADRTYSLKIIISSVCAERTYSLKIIISSV